MNAFALPLVIYYFLVIAVVCLYGLHRYWVTWVFLRTRSARPPVPPPPSPDDLPRVTVQIPMYNEKRVARRIIDAAAGLDYPHDRLQIQVLDDSTDETAELARRCCERHAATGVDIRFLHRDHREGYKAGALARALPLATGELIAVFDADFVPPPDFLRHVVPDLSDPGVGMVQARWTHLNANDSILTRIQALFLDGHFVVEQTARSRAGRWFNFNGTAGVWRRSCIEDAGGWQLDTLTEDTDLSYRAQLAGWRFVYRDDVTCPAEIPPTISAFLSQQHRWNKGLIQTAVKLLPRILRSDAPLATKVEAWFHLTSPFVHIAILLLVTLVVPSLLLTLPLEDVDRVYGLLYGGAFLGLGACAAGAFYLASQWAQGASLWRTIWRLPALFAIGIGITVLNTRAIIEALLGRHSPFVRTPKFAGDLVSEPDPAAAPRRRRLPAGMVETALGVVMLACFVIATMRSFSLVAAPFILLFAAGFLAVGIASWRDDRRAAARVVSRALPADTRIPA